MRLPFTASSGSASTARSSPAGEDAALRGGALHAHRWSIARGRGDGLRCPAEPLSMYVADADAGVAGAPRRAGRRADRPHSTRGAFRAAVCRGEDTAEHRRRRRSGQRAIERIVERAVQRAMAEHVEWHEHRDAEVERRTQAPAGAVAADRRGAPTGGGQFRAGPLRLRRRNSPEGEPADAFTWSPPAPPGSSSTGPAATRCR